MTAKSKTKQLVEAYKVAAEGHDLEYFKEMLRQHVAALDDEANRKAELAAVKEQEKADKKEKKKRKSEVKADTDIEMEDADAEPKKTSKKRKKEIDDEEDNEKVSRTYKRPSQLTNTDSLQRLRRLPS